MLTLYIRNVSHCKPISDYEFVVMVNDEIIAKGEVKGHKRSKGWRELIRKISEIGEDK